MSTLILPCAGRSSRFPNLRPKWMLTYPDGELMIHKTSKGLYHKKITRTIITVVKEHCDKYESDIIAKQAVPNAEICILPEFTKSQSDTVAQTIKKMNATGSLLLPTVIS